MFKSKKEVSSTLDKKNINQYNQNKKKKALIGFLLAIIFFSVGFISSNLFRDGSILGNTTADAKLNNLKKLIGERYYKDASDKTLATGSYKGVFESLNDPYSIYMTPEEYKQFKDSSDATYVGIGIQVSPVDNKIQITTVFKGSPAEKSGIQSGDTLTGVEGIDYTAEQLDVAISAIKGKEGQPVKISISRDGKVKEYNVVRAKVIMETVKSEMLDNSMGYISVSEFDTKTGEDFDKAIDELKTKGMKSIIVDLRGNPGGLLTQCMKISSNFIPKGKVIMTMTNKDGDREEYKSDGGKYNGLPVVIMIDGGSASASEVFTGAMEDYKLATLVGEKSFGKGIVQTIYEIGDGSAVKVTTASYQTPNGTNIHKIGINPDVEVVYPDDLKSKPYNKTTDPQLKMAIKTLKDKLK